MCEPLKRNPVRIKKPPKSFQFDDTEYGFGSLKAESKPATLGLKESVQNDSESAAIAKLLIKLIKSTNQKYQQFREKQLEGIQGRLQNDPLVKTLQQQSALATFNRLGYDGNTGDLKDIQGYIGPNKKIKTEGNISTVQAQQGKKRGKYAVRSKSPKRKEQKHDLRGGKPFKRQSYHVAVAYNIWIDLNKTNNKTSVDPTLAALKLKQTAQQ